MPPLELLLCLSLFVSCASSAPAINSGNLSVLKLDGTETRNEELRRLENGKSVEYKEIDNILKNLFLYFNSHIGDTSLAANLKCENSKGEKGDFVFYKIKGKLFPKSRPIYLAGTQLAVGFNKYFEISAEKKFFRLMSSHIMLNESQNISHTSFNDLKTEPKSTNYLVQVLSSSTKSNFLFNDTVEEISSTDVTKTSVTQHENLNVTHFGYVQQELDKNISQKFHFSSENEYVKFTIPYDSKTLSTKLPEISMRDQSGNDSKYNNSSIQIYKYVTEMEKTYSLGNKSSRLDSISVTCKRCGESLSNATTSNVQISNLTKNINNTDNMITHTETTEDNKLNHTPVSYLTVSTSLDNKSEKDSNIPNNGITSSPSLGNVMDKEVIQNHFQSEIVPTSPTTLDLLTTYHKTGNSETIFDLAHGISKQEVTTFNNSIKKDNLSTNTTFNLNPANFTTERYLKIDYIQPNKLSTIANASFFYHFGIDKKTNSSSKTITRSSISDFKYESYKDNTLSTPPDNIGATKPVIVKDYSILHYNTMPEKGKFEEPTFIPSTSSFPHKSNTEFDSSSKYFQESTQNNKFEYNPIQNQNSEPITTKNYYTSSSLSVNETRISQYLTSTRTTTSVNNSMEHSTSEQSVSSQRISEDKLYNGLTNSSLNNFSRETFNSDLDNYRFFNKSTPPTHEILSISNHSKDIFNNSELEPSYRYSSSNRMMNTNFTTKQYHNTVTDSNKTYKTERNYSIGLSTVALLDNLTIYPYENVDSDRPEGKKIQIFDHSNATTLPLIYGHTNNMEKTEKFPNEKIFITSSLGKVISGSQVKKFSVPQTNVTASMPLTTITASIPLKPATASIPMTSNSVIPQTATANTPLTAANISLATTTVNFPLTSAAPSDLLITTTASNLFTTTTARNPLTNITASIPPSASTPMANATGDIPLTIETTSFPLTTFFSSISTTASDRTPLKTSAAGSPLPSATTSIPLTSATDDTPLMTAATSISLTTAFSSITMTARDRIQLTTAAVSNPMTTATDRIPLKTATTSIPLTTDFSIIPTTACNNNALKASTASIPLASATTSIPLATITTSTPPTTTTTSTLTTAAKNFSLATATASISYPNASTNIPLTTAIHKPYPNFNGSIALATITSIPQSTTTTSIPVSTADSISLKTTGISIPLKNTNRIPLPSTNASNPLTTATSNMPSMMATTSIPLAIATTRIPLTSTNTKTPTTTDNGISLATPTTSIPSPTASASRPLTTTTRIPIPTDNDSIPLATSTTNTIPPTTATTIIPLTITTRFPLPSTNASSPLTNVISSMPSMMATASIPSVTATTRIPLTSTNINTPKTTDNGISLTTPTTSIPSPTASASRPLTTTTRIPIPTDNDSIPLATSTTNTIPPTTATTIIPLTITTRFPLPSTNASSPLTNVISSMPSMMATASIPSVTATTRIPLTSTNINTPKTTDNGISLTTPTTSIPSPTASASRPLTTATRIPIPTDNDSIPLAMTTTTTTIPPTTATTIIPLTITTRFPLPSTNASSPLTNVISSMPSMMATASIPSVTATTRIPLTSTNITTPKTTDNGISLTTPTTSIPSPTASASRPLTTTTRIPIPTANDSIPLATTTTTIPPTTAATIIPLTITTRFPLPSTNASSPLTNVISSMPSMMATASIPSVTATTRIPLTSTNINTPKTTDNGISLTTPTTSIPSPTASASRPLTTTTRIPIPTDNDSIPLATSTTNTIPPTTATTIIPLTITTRFPLPSTNASSPLTNVISSMPSMMATASIPSVNATTRIPLTSTNINTPKTTDNGISLTTPTTSIPSPTASASRPLTTTTRIPIPTANDSIPLATTTTTTIPPTTAATIIPLTITTRFPLPSTNASSPLTNVISSMPSMMATASIPSVNATTRIPLTSTNINTPKTTDNGISLTTPTTSIPSPTASASRPLTTTTRIPLPSTNASNPPTTATFNITSTRAAAGVSLMTSNSNISLTIANSSYQLASSTTNIPPTIATNNIQFSTTFASIPLTDTTSSIHISTADDSLNGKLNNHNWIEELVARTEKNNPNIYNSTPIPKSSVENNSLNPLTSSSVKYFGFTYSTTENSSQSQVSGHKINGGRTTINEKENISSADALKYDTNSTFYPRLNDSSTVEPVSTWFDSVNITNVVTIASDDLHHSDTPKHLETKPNQPSIDHVIKPKTENSTSINPLISANNTSNHPIISLFKTVHPTTPFFVSPETYLDEITTPQPNTVYTMNNIDLITGEDDTEKRLITSSDTGISVLDYKTKFSPGKKNENIFNINYLTTSIGNNIKAGEMQTLTPKLNSSNLNTKHFQNSITSGIYNGRHTEVTTEIRYHRSSENQFDIEATTQRSANLNAYSNEGDLIIAHSSEKSDYTFTETSETVSIQENTNATIIEKSEGIFEATTQSVTPILIPNKYDDKNNNSSMKKITSEESTSSSDSRVGSSTAESGMDFEMSTQLYETLQPFNNFTFLLPTTDYLTSYLPVRIHPLIVFNEIK